MEKLLKPVKLSIDPNSSSATKEWKHWIRTFKAYVSRYLQTSDEEQADQDKLAALISCATPQVYELFDHCSTYVEAEETLDKLFVKKPNDIFARHLLRSATQKANQSLAEFRSRLVKLAKDCEFTDVSASQYRDEMIRDSFINGILSAEIRQRLLENKTLSMKQAYDQALIMDEAKRESRMFVNQQSIEAPIEEVNSMQVNDEESEKVIAVVNSHNKSACFKCGSKKPHDFRNCRAKFLTCYKCGEKGHVSKACYLQKKAGAPSRVRSVANIEDSAVINEFLLSINDSTPSPKIIISSEVNGRTYRTLLDTGSSKSFVSEAVAIRFGLKSKKVKPFHVSMAEFSSIIQIQKVCKVRLKVLESVYENWELYIMKNLCEDVLLGTDFLGLHQEVAFKFGGRRGKLTVSNDSCGVVIAKVAAPSLFGNLISGWRPIASKSRRFNIQDKSFIKSTVDEWKKAGTIRRSKSPWRAQCVIVKNADGQIQRLAIDYSQTVNIFTEKDGYPIPLIEDMVNDLAGFRYFASYDLKRAYHQVPIPEQDKPFTAFEAGGELYEFNVIPFGVTNGGPVFQRIMSDILKEDSLTDTFVYFDNVIVGAPSLAELNSRAAEFRKSMQRRNMTLNDSKTVYGVTELNILGYCVGNNVIKPDPERLKPLLELPPPTSLKSLKRILGLFAYYAKWVPGFSDRISLLKSVKQFPLKTEELRDFEIIKKTHSESGITSH